MEHYDFIALGGGGAGLTAAHSIRAAGKKVAVIDPTLIGGLCALNGCNPKKVLVRAAEILSLVRASGEHGIRTGEVAIDWSAVIDRKRAFTDPVTKGAETGLARAGIEYLKTPARFTGENTLDVGARRLSFDGILISTGSAPRRLNFPGAQYVSTSDEILERRAVPRRLAIIGGGVVACEFGHVFARLGSQVHMLVRDDRPLRREDGDTVTRLVEHLRGLGLDLRLRVEVKELKKGSGAYDLRLSDGTTLSADFVLNAAGRPPKIEGLDLEKASVPYDEKGVKVTDYLRSPGNPRVFAAGDAHGRMQLSPVAGYEGALVAHNFLHGDSRRADYDAIPHAIFTVPPLASVGMTEEKARLRGLELEVAAEDMSGWTVFRIAGEKPAFGKVISEKKSGRIVGAHLFCPGADEHIHVFAMAMRYGIPRGRLGEMIYVYPAHASTLSYLTPSTGAMA